MTGVLLSIKPKYVESILNHEKHYEFRKCIFNVKGVSTVYIYTTAPVKKITASFKVGGIIKASPQELWERLGSVSGLTKDEFFNYYKNSNFGYAIKIEDLVEYDSPIDPYQNVPDFTPPQSFQYLFSINKSIQEKLM